MLGNRCEPQKTQTNPYHVHRLSEVCLSTVCLSPQYSPAVHALRILQFDAKKFRCDCALDPLRLSPRCSPQQLRWSEAVFTLVPLTSKFDTGVKKQFRPFFSSFHIGDAWSSF